MDHEQGCTHHWCYEKYRLCHSAALCKEGWDVCITSRDDKGAQEAATRLQTEYPDVKIEGIAYEQSNVENIRAGFRRVKELFGRLDAFIPNAAHLAVGLDSLTTTPEQWDEVMNANLRGTFFGCQEAAKMMVENDGGAIAVVSSVHANQSIPGRVAYSASKAGRTLWYAAWQSRWGICIFVLIP